MMKRYTGTLLAIALITLVLSAACSKAANSNNANSGGANTNASTNTNTKSTTTSSQTSLDLSSPTSAFKAFYDAAKNKNADALRKSLSKGSIAFLEAGAKAQNKTIEEVVAASSPPASQPETRNEKITGDTATLEVKDADTGNWETLNFVRENGEWKVALDKGTGNDNSDSDKPSSEKSDK